MILAEWGCEPPWLRPPEISRGEDPEYARITGDCLQHLVARKGYTCTRYFRYVYSPAAAR